MNTKEIYHKKALRLKNYDYSSPGYYFVTLCIYNRANLLGTIINDNSTPSSSIKLSSMGQLVKASVLNIPLLFNNVHVASYIIMPNHVHLMVVLGKHGDLPLHQIIGRVKSYTTKQYNVLVGTTNATLWQYNYYEHIIRAERELLSISEYILNNPFKWSLDKYFMP